jgi:hypothetical protein
MSKMPVGQKLNLVFHLEGTEEDDFSAGDLDLYVEGLDPELSNGVEAWDADAYEDMHREAKGERPEGYIEVDESAVEAGALEPEEPEEDVGEGAGEKAEGEAEPDEPEDSGPGEERSKPREEVKTPPNVEEEEEVVEAEETEEQGDESLLDDLEEPDTGRDASGEDDDAPWDVNGGKAEATSANPAGPPLKVASIKAEAPPIEGPEDPSTDDDGPPSGPPRQSAIADFDDEFRMEMID